MTKQDVEFNELIKIANNFLAEEFSSLSQQKREKLNCKTLEEWVERNIKEIKFIYLQNNDTQSVIDWLEKQARSKIRSDDGGWDTKIKLADGWKTVDVKSDKPTNKYIDAGKIEFTNQGTPLPVRADYVCGIQEDAVSERVTSMYFVKREKLKSTPLKDIWPDCPPRRGNELHWTHKKNDKETREAIDVATRKNKQRGLTT